MRLIAATILVLFLSATALAGTAYDIMAPVVRVRMQRSLGSGVVVASSDQTTLVVTNAHVVGRGKDCFIEVFIWGLACASPGLRPGPPRARTCPRENRSSAWPGFRCLGPG